MDINPDEFLAQYLAEIIGNPELIAGDPSFPISDSREAAKMRKLMNMKERGTPQESKIADEFLKRGGIVLPKF